MKKISLFFIFLFIAGQLFSQKPVVTKVWEHSLNSTAVWDGGIPIVPGEIPAWMGNLTERGMAFYDGNLYLMSRKVDPPVIIVLDAETGNKVSEIPVDMSVVTGGTFVVNDLMVTPSGKIIFSNLSTNTKTQPFKVYVMAEKAPGEYETSVLVEWTSDSSSEELPMHRLGDGFTMFGDVSAEEDGFILVGDANATAPFSEIPLVFRWNVQAGVAVSEPEVIELKEVYPTPIGTAVPKLGISPRIQIIDNDHFWADGHSTYPAFYNMQGELLSTFKGKTKPVMSGISGVCFFSFRGADYIAAPATNHAAPGYAPKAAFELFAIPEEGAEKADSIALFPELGLGSNTNGSYAAPVVVDVQPSKAFMYILSPYNGVGCYQLTMEGEVGNNTWNMSDPQFNGLGSMTEIKEVDGLTIFAAEGKNVDVDANKKSLDGWDFTHRLKFGGTGAFDEDGKALNRVVAFPVPGSSKITVYLQSASSSADRILNVAVNNKDNTIGEIQALGAAVSKGEVTYTGDAGTVYLYSPNSGVNIYLIKVEPLGTSAPQIPVNRISEFKLFPNPAQERVFISVDKPVEVGVFSMTGSLILTKKIESSQDPLDVSGLTPGMYLVRTLKSNEFALKLIVQ